MKLADIEIQTDYVVYNYSYPTRDAAHFPRVIAKGRMERAGILGRVLAPLQPERYIRASNGTFRYSDRGAECVVAMNCMGEEEALVIEADRVIEPLRQRIERLERKIIAQRS